VLYYIYKENKGDTLMKFVVEWYTTNSNEVSPEFDEYLDARFYAIIMSQLAGVSEAKVFDEEGTELGRYVDGEFAPITCDDDWYEFEDEDDYAYDEVGYNPYTGGYDEDL
jgi:hypothetical protein